MLIIKMMINKCKIQKSIKYKYKMFKINKYKIIILIKYKIMILIKYKIIILIKYKIMILIKYKIMNNKKIYTIIKYKNIL